MLTPKVSRMSVRPPAVAGLFYPARPQGVEADLGRLIPQTMPKLPATAVMVPHAGWMYSGRVAGEVYGRLEVPRIAVILGPNHTGRGPSGSIMCHGRWAFPGGELPIAEEVARRILAASPLLQEDERAHSTEHAVEVQLPFLRRVRPDIAFVPITLKAQDLGSCGEVGQAIASVVAGIGEAVMLVCSTDLNHYESQAISHRKDRLAIEAILSLDPKRLGVTVREHDISMCGLGPALATLTAYGELGQGRGELVSYATSGDVTGDYGSVVGYAGVVLY